MEIQSIYNNQNNFENIEELTAPHFKTYYKDAVMNTVWF